jgi:hypothetical protein
MVLYCLVWGMLLLVESFGMRPMVLLIYNVGFTNGLYDVIVAADT